MHQLSSWVKSLIKSLININFHIFLLFPPTYYTSIKQSCLDWPSSFFFLFAYSLNSFVHVNLQFFLYSPPTYIFTQKFYPNWLSFSSFFPLDLHTYQTVSSPLNFIFSLYIYQIILSTSDLIFSLYTNLKVVYSSIFIFFSFLFWAKHHSKVMSESASSSSFLFLDLYTIKQSC